MTNDQKITKTETVLIEVNQGDSSVKIGRNARLENKVIEFIQFMSPDQLSHGQDNKPNVSMSVFKKCFVTLENHNSEQMLNKCPVTKLATDFNDGKLHAVTETAYAFENSEIHIAESTGTADGTVLIMLIGYREPNK